MLLIIDLETTGTDPAVDHVVEVGAVLFDVDLAVPVACKSALVRAESNPAELVNGIPAAALTGSWCITPEQVRPMLAGFAKLSPEPPIWVAHNAAFDRQWLPGLGDRWLCTYEDATWPRMPGETGSLVKVELIAQVSYDDRELAKRAGFRWDGERKVWAKWIGESRIYDFTKGLPFAVDRAREAA